MHKLLLPFIKKTPLALTKKHIPKKLLDRINQATNLKSIKNPMGLYDLNDDAKAKNSPPMGFHPC